MSDLCGQKGPKQTSGYPLLICLVFFVPIIILNQTWFSHFHFLSQCLYTLYLWEVVLYIPSPWHPFLTARTFRSDMNTAVRQDNDSPVLLRLTLISLSLSHLCLCVFSQMLRYHITENPSAGQTDAARAVSLLWKVSALKWSCRGLCCVRHLSAESCLPQDTCPCSKPQQWASLSGRTIILTHDWKWQESEVHWRSHLMSPRYVLVINQRAGW